MRTSANDLFGKNSRPSTFYHHRLTTLMYSEGIKEMVETRKTVWILDVIIKLHYDYDYKVHNRTIWEVMRLRNNDLYVFATDPEGTVLAAEHIKDIEFIYDDATFWLVDHVLMFPLNYNYSYSSFKTKYMRTSANNFFGSSNGTGVYYQYNLSKMKYTDGVKGLAE
ncbi:MAG: DUF6876 family protein [Ferruginibacter sp.]